MIVDLKNEDNKTTALFKGKVAKDLVEYICSESTFEEKEELIKALEFYKQHCPPQEIQKE